MKRISRILIAGILSLLPIIVTVFIAGWVINLAHEWAGPDSGIGRVLVSMGLNISSSPALAYVVGIVILFAAILALGLIVESSWRPLLERMFDRVLRSIPLVSSIYDLSKRFVSMIDRSNDVDMQNMSPVWCFFGGEGGAAVLALMPSPQPVMVGEQQYFAILVPSAPVPIGGALIYVPSDWIKPAEGGIEQLMSVYVSMGLTPPESVSGATTNSKVEHD